ncbi:single-stranded DNA-binding protein [Psychrobacillus sp. NPDC096426]|uniref:single-stranded DNA-binding protein n=1 Tax=Psychrobacillus sp. NPDC096426 TaxID=3364491 RepID=UPI00381A92B9
MNCLEIAVKETKYLQSDEEFLVKDLFKGYEWNRLAIGERRLLGSLFLNEVKNGRLKDGIKVTKKSSANQQIYTKI